MHGRPFDIIKTHFLNMNLQNMFSRENGKQEIRQIFLANLTEEHILLKMACLVSFAHLTYEVKRKQIKNRWEMQEKKTYDL